MLGGSQQASAVKSMVSSKRRSVNNNFVRQTIMREGISEANRMSQRPTMLSAAGKSTASFAFADGRESSTKEDDEKQRAHSEGSMRATEMFEPDQESGYNPSESEYSGQLLYSSM